jgi:hypothetical protein
MYQPQPSSMELSTRKRGRDDEDEPPQSGGFSEHRTVGRPSSICTLLATTSTMLMMLRRNGHILLLYPSGTPLSSVEASNLLNAPHPWQTSHLVDPTPKTTLVRLLHYPHLNFSIKSQDRTSRHGPLLALQEISHTFPPAKYHRRPHSPRAV